MQEFVNGYGFSSLLSLSMWFPSTELGVYFTYQYVTVATCTYASSVKVTSWQYFTPVLLYSGKVWCGFNLAIWRSKKKRQIKFPLWPRLTGHSRICPMCHVLVPRKVRTCICFQEIPLSLSGKEICITNDGVRCTLGEASGIPTCSKPVLTWNGATSTYQRRGWGWEGMTQTLIQTDTRLGA